MSKGILKLIGVGVVGIVAAVARVGDDVGRVFFRNADNFSTVGDDVGRTFSRGGDDLLRASDDIPRAALIPDETARHAPLGEGESLLGRYGGDAVDAADISYEVYSNASDDE